MRTLIKNVCGFLLILLGLFSGVFLFLLALKGGAYLDNVYKMLITEWLPPEALTTKAILGLSGAFVAIISFVFAWTVSWNPKKRKTIRFSNPAGDVQISSDAIESYVKKVASRIEGVSKIRDTTMKEGDGGLIVITKADFQVEQNLPELTATLQTAIQEALRVKLGLEQVSKVNVQIGSIGDKKGTSQTITTERTPAYKPTPAQETESVFNGNAYQYDEDESEKI